MPRKIIIDTDPGVDDAMAIFFALAAPELDVIGLTTIFGNVHTTLATTNALRLLEIAGRSDIPVAKGADNPLSRPYKGPVPYVHGDDGQGNQHLPPPTTQPVAHTAAQFIIEQVLNAPGEITLVPIGPLTNIALALRLEPRIAGLVREVVLMGGAAFGPGNASPAAEANILNDAEAADVVFGAGWPVTMIGLDVTHEVFMSSAHLAEYGKIDNPLTQHISRIVPFYADFFASRYQIDGIFVHDSSAIAYVIDPSLFTCVQAPVRVDTDSGISRGKTWPNLGPRILPAWENRPLVNIARAVEGDRLAALELDYLRNR